MNIVSIRRSEVKFEETAGVPVVPGLFRQNHEVYEESLPVPSTRMHAWETPNCCRIYVSREHDLGSHARLTQGPPRPPRRLNHRFTIVA